MNIITKKSFTVPKEVQMILGNLKEKGYVAYAVGGCVRDLLLGRPPKDWDVATNAKPEEIQGIFPDSFYENAFGTVGVKTGSEDPALSVVEITTFRCDIGYSDKRHPDRIEFAETIEEDLSRRDFTVNALALSPAEGIALNIGKSDFHITDPFNGRDDLQDKFIRAVGEPEKRFDEDALRMMRAVRFATELGFVIEEQTAHAIKKHAGLLEFIAKERIADELRKIVMTDKAAEGIELLRELGLLVYILPELEAGFGVTQNKHHIYTVWEHNVRSLRYAVEQGYGFVVRLAALLHDVGKPAAKRGEGSDSTFYGHEVIGAKMAVQMLARLRFPKEETEKIALLVRAHMFNYDPDVVTDASVRRLVAKVGAENIKELVRVREADRIGSGVPKAVPYKLRHFMFRVEKVLTEPVSRKVMAVNGEDIMATLGIPPGLRVGAILDLLFEEILDDPSYNNKEYLFAKTKELGALSDETLAKMRKAAQDKYQALLQAEEEGIKAKYHVK